MIKRTAFASAVVGLVLLFDRLQRQQRTLQALQAEVQALRPLAERAHSFDQMFDPKRLDAYEAKLSPEDRVQRAIWIAEGRITRDWWAEAEEQRKHD